MIDLRDLEDLTMHDAETERRMQGKNYKDQIDLIIAILGTPSPEVRARRGHLESI